ncbi:MAG TPA: hypothetical protein VFW71_11600 [Actinomycetota bacterium]|nr:hypothetical protein [Actinomycetota bacterium]
MTDHSAAATDVEPPEAPAPALETLTIISGDNQTVSAIMTEHGFPMATFAPVAAALRDASGAPLAGEEVSWSVGETPGNMGIQLDPHGRSPLVVTTDEAGVATLDHMRGSALSAFYDWGSFDLMARHGRAAAAAHLSVAPPLSLTTSIIAGDNQQVQRSAARAGGAQARFAPVQIRVKDSEGQPAVGIPVVFTAVSPADMIVELTPGQEEATVTTDAEGIATLDLMDGDSMVCHGADGDFKITVRPTGSKQVVAHQTVIP